jgi:hypothetical protein
MATIKSSLYQNEEPETSTSATTSSQYDFITNINNPIKSPQTCIEIKVDDDLEPLSVENAFKLFEVFGDQEFVLIFRTVKSNSLAFYWRVRETKRILSLECEVEEELCGFIKEFLLNTVKNGERGIIL